MPSNPILQAQTLQTADKRYEGWTLADIDFVRETRDLPAVEVATALGRTLNAIYMERWVADQGPRRANLTNAPRRAPQAATSLVVACGTCYTVHPAGVDCY